MQPAAHAPKDPAAAPAPVIEGRDLVKQFGGLRAVDGMSIALRPGEMLGLIGPNGAGKTTLFNLLAGSLAPSAGSIRVAGRELSRRGPEQRIAHGVARTFQIPRPFAEMTVLENVLTGRQNQMGERIWLNLVRPGRVAAEERAAVAKARALLDFVTLSHLEHEPAMQLDLPLGLADERRRPGSRKGNARWLADRAVDRIRERFGWDAVGYGSVALGGARSVPDAFRELAEKDL